MPRLRLTLNIGSSDARRLGLDPAAAREGGAVEASGKAAAELLRRGWAEAEHGEDAVHAPQAAPAPATARVDLKAVPPVEVKADGDDAAPAAAAADDGPDLESMTKDELRSYAEEYGIPGVSAHQTKAEMVALIRKAIS